MWIFFNRVATIKAQFLQFIFSFWPWWRHWGRIIKIFLLLYFLKDVNDIVILRGSIQRYLMFKGLVNNNCLLPFHRNMACSYHINIGTTGSTINNLKFLIITVDHTVCRGAEMDQLVALQCQLSAKPFYLCFWRFWGRVIISESWLQCAWAQINIYCKNKYLMLDENNF